MHQTGESSDESLIPTLTDGLHRSLEPSRDPSPTRSSRDDTSDQVSSINRTVQDGNQKQQTLRRTSSTYSVRSKYISTALKMALQMPQYPDLQSKANMDVTIAVRKALQRYEEHIHWSARTRSDLESSSSNIAVLVPSMAIKKRAAITEEIQPHTANTEGEILTPSRTHQPPFDRSGTRATQRSSIVPNSVVVNQQAFGSRSQRASISANPNTQQLQLLRSFLKHWSCLDKFLSHREEMKEWDRLWPSYGYRTSDSIMCKTEGVADQDPLCTRHAYATGEAFEYSHSHPDHRVTTDGFHQSDGTDTGKSPRIFRHWVVEVGFCFTIAATQFLAEYLISGFAIALPKLLTKDAGFSIASISAFWPASLLSLILSACLLIFARLSDMHGGYPYFMFGVCWLALWALIPGFSNDLILLDVARAMQGLAIAAFTPSAFAIIGSIYPTGPRRNFVLGVYGAMAPLGFFAGFLAGGVLSANNSRWYTWTASILSSATAVGAYLTVPTDTTNRKSLALKMDWLGGFLITAGLVLVAYAFAVEPYANISVPERNSFSLPTVLGPFLAGAVCLAAAVWVEGWVAECPLVPFEFFKPRSVIPFCFACLSFYACFGTWLYNSTEYFQSPSTTGHGNAVEGLQLALWYTPTAVGGLFFCIAGGWLAHLVSLQTLLVISGLAWIGAPLILALCPTPLDYWSSIMPSTLCATLGIDLTYTISIIFLSSVQPLRYQGLAGAVCSILINLDIPFALSISEMIGHRARSDYVESHPRAFDTINGEDLVVNAYYRATFIYAAASAGLGFVVCVLFVRINRSVLSANSGNKQQGKV